MKTIDEIRRIKKAAEGELLRLPGVTGVDIGYKLVNGEKTDVMAIRVYVCGKRRRDDLDPAEVIPSEIDGVPTDVIERDFVLHS